MTNGVWGSSGRETGRQWDAFTFSSASIPPRRLSFSRSSLLSSSSSSSSPSSLLLLSAPQTSTTAPSTTSPSTTTLSYRKRPRPLADVDGEGSNGLQKKKRRLRLLFVTSRLSLPFSSPSTHIVGRGSSKIAVWAKQKALGRSLLRKAAIMNRVWKHILFVREREPEKLGAINQLIRFLSSSSSSSSSSSHLGPKGLNKSFSTTTTATATTATPATPTTNLRPRSTPQKPSQHLPLPPDLPHNPPSPPPTPRRHFIPLPPSPLSLTNYDVFDNEDGYFDSDSDAESDSDERPGGSRSSRSSRVYSDFNVLEPSEPVVEDHDSISAFDSLSFGSQWLLPTEILKEDERTTGIMKEKERQKELSFVNFGY